MTNNGFSISLQQVNTQVVIRVKNISGTYCRVLKWHTILDYPYVHGFIVNRNEQASAYIGPYFKRLFDSSISLVEFAPDQEIKLEYELADILGEFELGELRADDQIRIGVAQDYFEVYDAEASLIEGAEAFYRVPAESDALILQGAFVLNFIEKKSDGGIDSSNLSIASESIALCVIGHNNGYEQVGPTSRFIVGYPVTANLNGPAIRQINLAVKEIFNFLTFTFRNVENNAHYKRWFGTFSEANRQKVYNTIKSLNRGACPSYIVYDGSRTSLCTGDTYAFIRYNRDYNDHPKQCSQAEHFCHQLFLCSLFWKRPLKGENSQVGIFLHELSHGYAYTKDHAYGKVKCIELAKKSPQTAIENADNIEYYLEELIR